MVTRSISVIGIDPEGVRFASQAYADAAWAGWDQQLPTNGQIRIANGHGARNVTPSPREISEWSAGVAPSAAKANVVRNILSRTGDAVVSSRAEAGVTFLAHEDPSVIRSGAQALANRFAAHGHQVNSVFPCGSADHASEGCPLLPFHRSHADGVLTCILHYDRAGSPFSLAQSPQGLDRFVEWLCTSVCVGQGVFPDNPTPHQVYASLGDIAPCASFSFHSDQVSTGREVSGWPKLRKAVGGRYTAAHADLVDIVGQLQHATRAALREPSALALNQPVNLDAPYYVVCSLPLRQSRDFCDVWERYQVWLGSEFPNARPIAVPGGGLPLLNAQGERFVNVGAVYPLPRPVAKGGARNVKR